VVRNPGAAHAAIAPYGPFGCGDGEVVFLGIQNEREWKMFCEEVLGREGMTEDHRFDKNSRRVENRDELHAEIESVFSGLSSEEVIERLERAGVANARMRTVRQFLDHPQLEARNRWLLPPATLDGAEPVMTPIPEVGEHNERLLAELGYGRQGTWARRRDGDMMIRDYHPLKEPLARGADPSLEGA
jgi:itaconate CoA-transferase